MADDIDELIEDLEEGYGEDASIAAAERLGEIGDARAVEPLINAHLDGADEEIGDAAGKALEKIGKPAVERLIQEIGQFYSKGGYADYQYCDRMIAEILGNIGDARAIEPLVGMLGEYDEYDPFPDYSPRGSAANALDKLGWKPDTIEDKIDYFMAMEDFGALSDLGETAIDKLVWKLESDCYEGEPRDGIDSILVEIGKPAVQRLLVALETPYESTSVGESVAWILGEIGDARAIEPLIEYIDYQTEYGGSEMIIERIKIAATTIVKIKGTDIVDKEKENLLKFLESDDPALVQMGVSMLKGILEE